MVNDQPLVLSASVEHWPIAGTFTISRGAKTEAAVVVVELVQESVQGSFRGRGECVPYARYGETVEAVVATLDAAKSSLKRGLDRTALQRAMPPGAARNALDCAFWDLEAKRAGRPVHALAGLPAPAPRITAYTLSLDTPDKMAEAAARSAARKLLKVKLGGDGDVARIAAVRAAAPQSDLIVDANEGWTAANLEANLAACAAARVSLVEQPLPAGRDDMLATIARPLPVCADESVHDRASLGALAGKYDAVNIKLDKTGGLTEALAMVAEAERLGLQIMAGCMVATSLAMAPAMLVAQRARFVDLDGPLLLARDRANGLQYRDSQIFPPTPALWG
ncbi:MAG: N-acetyl-D-Glu racemase DgcA [Xanthobacteraceae bacterium]|uniref:N-acetyl-D-Glu racemase DgcA n=1 Tax=Pseudolabrys sp. TaxID=1960880 RepID=UPI003D0AD435